jgi:uncharacterized protein YdhG (YjbR/CyaY superfamily)
MIKKKAKPLRDVDDYLSRLPEDSRAILEKLRQTIKTVVPEATEGISYQIPTFKYQGRMLVSYAAFKEHYSFFPGIGPIEAHSVELKPFRTAKGTIQFTDERPLPVSLIKKIVKTRIKLNDAYLKKRATAGKKGAVRK